MHSRNAFKTTITPSPCDKTVAHLGANRVPLILCYMTCNTAIGNDFDAMLGHQDIKQYAIVVLGIPYTQLAESLCRPSRRIQAIKHRQRCQS